MTRIYDAATTHPSVEELDAVWTTYFGLLQRVASPLLDAGPTVEQQLRRQLEAVLVDVATSLGVRRAEPLGEKLSESIGRARASGGVHPAQSLQAASMIFDAALPTVSRWTVRAGDEGDPVARAATVLNREILRRMSLAAQAYVDLLLDRIHHSNQLERRSLSRGMHDVIAPAVAVGIQHLELHDVYRVTDPQRAAAKLDDARHTMVEAVTAIRGLSEYLRVDIGRQGLIGAVEKVLETVPPGTASELHVAGPLEDLPPAYAQEIFLIVREAVRNAVDHAAAQHIEVSLTLTADRVTGIVTDDGLGFALDRVQSEDHHVGLDSMHERAELLSGRVDITSAQGSGTTVHLTIPHTGVMSADAYRSAT